MSLLTFKTQVSTANSPAFILPIGPVFWLRCCFENTKDAAESNILISICKPNISPKHVNYQALIPSKAELVFEI